MKIFQANQTEKLNQLKCYKCFNSIEKIGNLFNRILCLALENWASKGKVLLSFIILDLSLLSSTLGRFGRSSSRCCGCRLLLLNPPRMPRYQLSDIEHQLFSYNIIKTKISSQEKMVYSLLLICADNTSRQMTNMAISFFFSFLFMFLLILV